MNYVSCNELTYRKDEHQISVVYFGAKEDIFENGKFSYFGKAQALDHLWFPDTTVKFFYNDEEECAKEIGIENGVAVLAHKTFRPVKVEFGDDTNKVLV